MNTSDCYIIGILLARDVVGTCTCTLVVLEYSFDVLVLVLLLEV